jgi:NAD dependent epimerase/dehydratase family enzyme
VADGAGAIVNLAGENPADRGFLPSRWTPERRRAIRESRVNAGLAVVQAVEGAAHEPSVVVQASGSDYYGPHGDEEVTEETTAGNDFLAQIARDD